MSQETSQDHKEIWERGLTALEKMLNYESIETIEKLAGMISDEDFRKTFKFKIVKTEIKNYKR